MTTKTMPAVDRELVIAPAEYTCPVTGDIWRRNGFTIKCSNDLFHTGKSYNDSLNLVPDGYRISALEEMAYIGQETERMKNAGGSPRDVLKDPLFDRLIRGDPYRWQYSAFIFRPPNGATDFTKYVEKDPQGRKYSRADIYLIEKLFAEGALMPHGMGSKVVEINTALLIPSVVSDGNEPQHVIHSYFEPKKDKIAVGLGGGWYVGGHDRCLAFAADRRPSVADPGFAFRIVQGSLDEVPIPYVEPFVKDRESFEKGKKIGLSKGRREGIRQLLTSLETSAFELVLKKYREEIK